MQTETTAPSRYRIEGVPTWQRHQPIGFVVIAGSMWTIGEFEPGHADAVGRADEHALKP
jgi:hypothetical protein